MGLNLKISDFRSGKNTIECELKKNSFDTNQINSWQFLIKQPLISQGREIRKV